MVSRATANFFFGVLIGSCTIIVLDRLRKAKFDDDPERIAKRLGRRIKALEARVDAATRAASGQMA